MSSDDEFRIISQNLESPDPQTRPLRRIASASTVKSIYIETPPSSPCATSYLNRDLNLITKARIQSISKKLNLNILVLGDSNIGKSSFINSLLIKYFHLINLKPKGLPKPTRSISCSKASLSNSELELCVSLIDSPGFGFFSSKENWLKFITDFIYNKSVEYKRLKKSVEKSQIEDSRVHLALYFIEGPRCKENDLKMMFHLQSIVNILPVLAKSDSYTPNEISQVKLEIINQCISAGISFFDIAVNRDLISEIAEMKLGSIPPFAISSSGKIVELNDSVKFFREYPWGSCDIHDKNVSDFEIICKCLFGYLVVPILESSKALNRRNLKTLKIVANRAKKLEEKQKRSRKINWLSKVASKLILNLL